MKKQLPTLINFILDRSGSMETIRETVISGFNEYINGLKTSKAKKNLLFSLTTFDTMGIEHPYTAVPISDVKPLTRRTFQPRAGTPLYDAAVNTIEDISTKVEPKQPVLVVIMTDGEENSSSEHDENCFKDLVDKLKAKGNWTFVFMGANQDAWGNAAKFGFDAGNTMQWASTTEGTKSAFRGLAGASASYCMAMTAAGGGGGGALNSSDFFNNSDDKLKGAVNAQ